MSHESRIARRYAKGLFSLAQGDLSKAKSQLQTLNVVNELFAEPEAERVLKSPVMPSDLKRDLLHYALKKSNATPDVLTFFQTIVDAGRVACIPDVIEAFSRFIDEAEGTVKAEVVSAVPMSEPDLAAIGSNVGRILGKKIQLHPAVDPALLGGFVVRVGNYRIDMSLRTKLDSLAQSAAKDSLI